MFFVTPRQTTGTFDEFVCLSCNVQRHFFLSCILLIVSVLKISVSASWRRCSSTYSSCAAWLFHNLPLIRIRDCYCSKVGLCRSSCFGFFSCNHTLLVSVISTALSVVSSCVVELAFIGRFLRNHFLSPVRPYSFERFRGCPWRFASVLLSTNVSVSSNLCFVACVFLFRLANAEWLRFSIVPSLCFEIFRVCYCCLVHPFRLSVIVVYCEGGVLDLRCSCSSGFVTVFFCFGSCRLFLVGEQLTFSWLSCVCPVMLQPRFFPFVIVLVCVSGPPRTRLRLFAVVCCLCDCSSERPHDCRFWWPRVLAL